MGLIVLDCHYLHALSPWGQEFFLLIFRSTPGFYNLDTTGIWTREFFVVRCYFVQCRMFSNISGLSPLDARGTPPPSPPTHTAMIIKNVSRRGPARCLAHRWHLVNISWRNKCGDAAVWNSNVFAGEARTLLWVWMHLNVSFSHVRVGRQLWLPIPDSGV